MHIGLEATTLRSELLGGVWRYTESLIAALCHLAAPHHYSLLFLNAFKPWARGPSPPAPVSEAMRLVEVTRMSNFLFTFLLPTIPRRWGGPAVESFLGSVDLFHSVNAVVLRQRRGRQVVTVHDLTCLQFPQMHPWSRRMLFRLGIHRAARLADAIIVPSSATRRDLAARFPATAEKTRVIPWAHGDQFAPLDPAVAAPVVARYGLQCDGYLLFVGNIEPRKNLLALVDAYDRLRRRTPFSPRLVLAGTAGWKNQALYQAVAASAFSADIRFLGHVPDADLPALMNGALALVYPSLYEGFGLPPLEAMACGTPVITSNRSSLPEVVGDAALMVDAGDRSGLAEAMARVVAEPSLREDLRERGLRQVRRFSWDETARMTLQVYEGHPAASPLPHRDSGEPDRSGAYRTAE